HPDFPLLNEQAAKVYLSTGAAHRAIIALEASQPEISPRVAYLLGSVSLNYFGDISKAAQNFEIASRNRDYQGVIFNLATDRFRLGDNLVAAQDYHQARRQFQIVIALTSVNDELHRLARQRLASLP
ncbi:MAG: hypothetical protein L0Z70_16130, partial [Chloroflexi bacterium]|nr:hypothetical protein [Chloroflexota bacterium]